MSTMKPRTISARSTGFTLIEVLVVMIMVALISGVLFQALERAYRLKERFGVELFNVQQGQMATDWYRQSINGLYPDYPDGANVFQGREQQLSGLSTNPLSDDYGITTAVTWKLLEQPQSGTTSLVYIENKQETTILSWHGRDARFIYLDSTRTPHDRWPPPLGLFSQIPMQIQIQARDAGENITLLASPMGPTTPPLRIKDLLGLAP